MVHRAADVHAGVDAGHYEVERVTEQAEPAVHDTQPRRAAHRPGARNPIHVGVVDLGAHQVEGPQRGAGPRVLGVGGHHGDIPHVDQGPGQMVEAVRVDAVVIGDQDAHSRRPYRRRVVRSLAAELGAEALPVGHERSRGVLGRLMFGHYGGGPVGVPVEVRVGQTTLYLQHSCLSRLPVPFCPF